MTKTEIEQIVRDNIAPLIHMSLATCAGGKPWVCEVHFAYDDELNLYFRSLTSRRHSQEIADNPHVSGNIVRTFGLGEPPVGVYFEGVAELLGPGKQRQHAFEVIKQRLEAGDDILAQADESDGHQFYKITVNDWYAFGRFGADKGQKLHLPWHN